MSGLLHRSRTRRWKQLTASLPDEAKPEARPKLLRVLEGGYNAHRSEAASVDAPRHRARGRVEDPAVKQRPRPALVWGTVVSGSDRAPFRVATEAGPTHKGSGATRPASTTACLGSLYTLAKKIGMIHVCSWRTSALDWSNRNPTFASLSYSLALANSENRKGLMDLYIRGEPRDPEDRSSHREAPRVAQKQWPFPSRRGGGLLCEVVRVLPSV